MSQALGSSTDGSPSTPKTITGSSVQRSGIRLTNVYDDPQSCSILYELLKERDEATNISHRSLPYPVDHINFFESRPYRHWYLVKSDEQVVGACYLTHKDEIGIFIFKAHQGKGYGRAAVRELMRENGGLRYKANINPQNERSANLFKSLGFKIIQHTYEA